MKSVRPPVHCRFGGITGNLMKKSTMVWIGQEKDFSMTGWQTMDTAPRDGTCILALNIDLRDGFDVVAWYNYDGGTWFINGTTLSRSEITHWMPLPKEPE